MGDATGKTSKGSGAKALLPLVIIAAATVALTLPGLVGPERTNDSFWIDWVWLDQFARELGHGTWYPRWLPRSHGGLGSPVFYFYPPLGFYAGALFVLAGFKPAMAVVMSFALATFTSGVGMFALLRGRAHSPLLGALLFMAAPYHLFDFTIRGALGEAWAIAFLPFVLWGLIACKARTRGALAGLGVAYGALVLSHLPLALLASLFLFGPRLLLDYRRDWRDSVPAVTGLALGIGLAAIFLVPAISLSPYRDTALLWANSVLQPANWTFWNTAMHANPTYLAILAIAATLALPAVILAIRERSGWAIYALAILALSIGAAPFVFSLPLLTSVQFPFRMLPLAELALCIALARANWPTQSKLLAIVPALVVSAFVLSARPPGHVPMSELQRSYPDVPENLPPGSRPYSWPSRWALDLARNHPESHCKAWSCNGTAVLFPVVERAVQRSKGRRLCRAFDRAPVLSRAIFLHDCPLDDVQ